MGPRYTLNRETNYRELSHVVVPLDANRASRDLQTTKYRTRTRLVGLVNGEGLGVSGFRKV
jgi:hypothetical protein